MRKCVNREFNKFTKDISFHYCESEADTQLV